MKRSIQAPVGGATVGNVNIKIAQGGAEGTDAATALAALHGVNSNLLNQANGVAGLDNNGVITTAAIPNDALTGICVTGPSILEKSTQGIYTIDNYDSFETYVISCKSGSFIRAGGIITYTAPNTVMQGGFTINGKYVEVAIYENYYKPIPTVITSPVNNATGVALNLTITAAAFAVASGSDTQLNADWQLATDINFTNIVQQSMGDYTNLVSWDVTGLTNHVTYYARARQNGTNSGIGFWSTPISFITIALQPDVIGEEAIMLPGNSLILPTAHFASAVDMTADGSRMVMGIEYGNETGASQYHGTAYVYVRDGTSWTKEAELVPDYPLNSTAFVGSSISITADGTRCVVGAYNCDVGGTMTANGAAFVFIRTGSTWAQEAVLLPEQLYVYTYFGCSVDISADGTRIVIGGSSRGGPNFSYGGSAFIFVRDGVSWTQEAMILDPAAATYDNFGYRVAICNDGSRVVISSYGKNNTQGAAYIFSRSGTSWTQEAVLVRDGGTANEQFAYSVCIDGIGSRVVIGDVGYQTGCAVVFSRIDTVWTQEVLLESSDAIAGEIFGYQCVINSAGDLLIITAPLKPNGEVVNVGAAYIFTRTGTTWTERAKLLPSVIQYMDVFGYTAAISDDGTRAVFGSPNYNYTSAPIGAAWIFTIAQTY